MLQRSVQGLSVDEIAERMSAPPIAIAVRYSPRTLLPVVHQAHQAAPSLEFAQRRLSGCCGHRGYAFDSVIDQVGCNASSVDHRRERFSTNVVLHLVRALCAKGIKQTIQSCRAVRMKKPATPYINGNCGLFCRGG